MLDFILKLFKHSQAMDIMHLAQKVMQGNLLRHQIDEADQAVATLGKVAIGLTSVHQSVLDKLMENPAAVKGTDIILPEVDSMSKEELEEVKKQAGRLISTVDKMISEK